MYEVASEAPTSFASVSGANEALRRHDRLLAALACGYGRQRLAWCSGRFDCNLERFWRAFAIAQDRGNAFPETLLGIDSDVFQIGLHAIATLLIDRSGDPRARLELLTRLADTVGRQGHPDRAQELLERALIESRELLGQADNLTLDIGVRVAGYETGRGSYDAARQRIDKLLAQIPPEVSELRIRVLRASASAAWHMHENERARGDGSLAVALSRKLGDAEVERETLTAYGATLLGVGAVAEAVTVYEKLLALNSAKYGPTHEQVALAWSGLSRAYRRSGNLEKAEDASHHALDIDRIIYPNDHWITANHLNALTMILVQKRDYEGAAEASREGLRITVNTLGENHIDRLSPVYQLGYALMLD